MLQGDKDSVISLLIVAILAEKGSPKRHRGSMLKLETKIMLASEEDAVMNTDAQMGHDLVFLGVNLIELGLWVEGSQPFQGTTAIFTVVVDFVL